MSDLDRHSDLSLGQRIFRTIIPLNVHLLAGMFTGKKGVIIALLLVLLQIFTCLCLGAGSS